MSGKTFNQSFIICEMLPDGIIGQDFLLKNVKTLDLENHRLNTLDGYIQLWTGTNYCCALMSFCQKK